MTRPTPTLPNPYEPIPGNSGAWVDALVQGAALIVLIAMFLFFLVSRGYM